jgi:hypothetical protein
MEEAARALAEADGAIERDPTAASTGRYILASRQIERLVTAGTLLSLIKEVRRAREAKAHD